MANFNLDRRKFIQGAGAVLTLSALQTDHQLDLVLIGTPDQTDATDS